MEEIGVGQTNLTVGRLRPARPRLYARVIEAALSRRRVGSGARPEPFTRCQRLKVE